MSFIWSIALKRKLKAEQNPKTEPNRTESQIGEMCYQILYDITERSKLYITNLPYL